jgi:uncharacterized coiled-coil protein SlyX
MARREDAKRIEDLERRSAMQEREMIILAETIKELATQLQHLAQSQKEILESHNGFLQQLADLEARTSPGNRNA